MTERFHFLRYFRFFGRSWQNIASKAVCPDRAEPQQRQLASVPRRADSPSARRPPYTHWLTAAHCTFRSFAIQAQISPDAAAPQQRRAAPRRHQPLLRNDAAHHQRSCQRTEANTDQLRPAARSSRPSSPARRASYPFVSCPSGIPPSPPLYGPVPSKRTASDFLLHRKRPSPPLHSESQNDNMDKEIARLRFAAGRSWDTIISLPSFPCGRQPSQPSAWRLPSRRCCCWRQRTSRTQRGRGRRWSR